MWLTRNDTATRMKSLLKGNTDITIITNVGVEVVVAAAQVAGREIANIVVDARIIDGHMMTTSEIIISDTITTIADTIDVDTMITLVLMTILTMVVDVEIEAKALHSETTHQKGDTYYHRLHRTETIAVLGVTAGVRTIVMYGTLIQLLMTKVETVAFLLFTRKGLDSRDWLTTDTPLADLLMTEMTESMITVSIGFMAIVVKNSTFEEKESTMKRTAVTTTSAVVVTVKHSFRNTGNQSEMMMVVPLKPHHYLLQR